MVNRISIKRPASADLRFRRVVLYRAHEESVVDERDACRPSELVQRKLQIALPASHIPVSTMHSQRCVRR